MLYTSHSSWWHLSEVFSGGFHTHDSALAHKVYYRVKLRVVSTSDLSSKSQLWQGFCMSRSMSSHVELSLAIKCYHEVCGDTQDKLAKALHSIEAWKDSLDKEFSQEKVVSHRHVARLHHPLDRQGARIANLEVERENSLERHWDANLAIQDMQDRVHRLGISQRQGIEVNSSQEASTGCKQKVNPVAKEKETVAPPTASCAHLSNSSRFAKVPPRTRHVTL